MLRMLGKEEEATPTLTAWLSSSPCPAPRNAPDGIGAKDRREVSNQRPRPNLGPPRPFPGEPLPQRVGGGGEGREMETGLGAAPLPLPLPGQAAFVPGGAVARHL